MGGASSSSIQVGNQNVTEQSVGTCNISCDNTMNNVGTNLINSNVAGDVGIFQNCSVNGQCVFNNSMTSITDLLFKAANAASSDPLSSIGGSSTMSYQEINQNIQEYSSQKCSVSSSNDMNNVFIYSVGSQIGGNLEIGQNGQATGNCTLNNIMKANADATGIADNCAASGKSAKKKSCKGKGGGIGTYILYFVVGIIAFTVIMMIIKFLRGGALPPCTDKTPQGTPCKPVKLAPCTKDTPPNVDCSPHCTKDTPKDTICYPTCNDKLPKGTPCYMKPLAPKSVQTSTATPVAQPVAPQAVPTEG